jgi:ElaA protein
VVVVTVHEATFAGVDAATLYEILRLRQDVFVVEQSCLYSDIDGRDLEPDTRHCWIAEDDRVVAYLRVLLEPDRSWRIGRVVTDPHARGRGLASSLVRDALTRLDGTVVLDAQTQVAAMYEAIGFAVDGPEFLEDGIPHLPMRLAANAPPVQR